ncbi:MAG TPA: hypothetical protein VF666_21575 [Pyrinomonadaceae bacterium]
MPSSLSVNRAPEIVQKVRIRLTNPAPVATVLASKATERCRPTAVRP